MHSEPLKRGQVTLQWRKWLVLYSVSVILEDFAIVPKKFEVLLYPLCVRVIVFVYFTHPIPIHRTS